MIAMLDIKLTVNVSHPFTIHTYFYEIVATETLNADIVELGTRGQFLVWDYKGHGICRAYYITWFLAILHAYHIPVDVFPCPVTLADGKIVDGGVDGCSYIF